MKRLIICFLAGFIFAVGLSYSGMTKPSKVINFLDFFGDWDPSLIFVMIGAIATTIISFQLILPKLSKPLLANSFSLPTSIKIDLPMIAGAAIFGTGWGLSGFCPGPVVASISTLNLEIFVFIVCMLLGMFIGKRLQSKIPLKYYRN